MIYKELGHSGVNISALSMGGHEYLPSGKSRGFNENFELATRPGHIFEGFGQERRKEVLSTAFDRGINFFDVTQDSEKEALGRNLKETPPPYEIYIQTRPEGMVYTYDLYNAKMAVYDLLKKEVQREVRLLRRDRLDFLNIAFMRSALDHDPEYLHKIKFNIEKLKKEGLIRFACADTFSGEYTYLKQIETGCFDAVYINFNFADDQGKKKVLPTAKARGLGVISREAFMKGELFKMGGEVGLTDRRRLSQIALKWNLSHEEVTTVVVGTGNPAHLREHLSVLNNLELTNGEKAIIEKVMSSPLYKVYDERKRREFLEQD